MKYRRRKQKIVRPVTDGANKTMKIVICIFLVVATFAVYWQVQDHDFITHYDDQIYVTDNLNVQAGLTRESVRWALPHRMMPIGFH